MTVWYSGMAPGPPLTSMHFLLRRSGSPAPSGICKDGDWEGAWVRAGQTFWVREASSFSWASRRWRSFPGDGELGATRADMGRPRPSAFSLPSHYDLIIRVRVRNLRR